MSSSHPPKTLLRQISQVLLILLGFGFAAGCGSRPPGSANGNATGRTDPVEANSSASADVAKTHAAQTSQGTSPDPKGQGEDTDAAPIRDGTIAASSTSVAKPKMPDASLKTVRVMLLASQGPLLIDLFVTRSGEPVTPLFESTHRQIFELTKRLLSPQDAPLVWKSLLSHPRFREGQFGNPVTGNYQSLAAAIRQFDTIQNDRVDFREFVRYLTNNRTSQGLSLLTSNYRQQESRRGSWIFGLLDRDKDRMLDADELARAPQRLLLRDLDDDGIVVRGELREAANLAANQASMPRQPRSTFTPKTACFFPTDNQGIPWSDVRVAWENAYAVGQPVRRDDLGQGGRLFDELDLDGDGTLDPIEMEMLAEVAADFVFRIDMAGENSQVTLISDRLPSEATRIQHQPNRIRLRIGGLVLDVFANHNDAGEPERDAASRFVNRFDQDNDGALTRAEYDAAPEPPEGRTFASLDWNGDDEITAAEFELLAAQQTIAMRDFLRLRADSDEDALFSTIDANSDGRLSEQEIESAANTMQALDKNRDGKLRSSELNESLLVGIALGPPQVSPNQSMPGPMLSLPAVKLPDYNSAPRWFTAMDRNQDQGISWREFLGTRDQFQALDSNQDKLVDVHEATQG